MLVQVYIPKPQNGLLPGASNGVRKIPVNLLQDIPEPSTEKCQQALIRFPLPFFFSVFLPSPTFQKRVVQQMA